MSTGTVGIRGRLRTVPGWRYFPRIFGLALALTAWILVASAFPEGLMPYPQEAVSEAYQLHESGELYPNLRATLWRALWGFLGAMAIGITIGVFAGLTRYGRHFLTPYIIAGLSIPGVAWAAVMTLIVGYNNWAPILAAVLTVFPYIAINVWKGVENIDMDLIQMSESFDVSIHRILWRVVIPNTAPSLFSASRFGLAITWRVVAIAEMFSARTGVGIRIIQTYNNFQFAEAWGWALVFMLIILVIEYGVFRRIESRMYEYRTDVQETTI